MRKTTAVVLVAMLALAVGVGTAAAEPNPDRPPLPSALPSVAASLALLTLTTIPDGWEDRMDLRPQLEVFADGKAVKSPDAVAADRGPDAPPKRVDGRIPPEVLTAALAETRSLAAADLGMANVTDRTSRIIDYMSQSPNEDVHLIVYAPEATDGLGAEQVASRKRFTDLYTKLLDAFIQGD
ncbi:hypothetical protein AB0C34_05370 [Nocardia sp. NPDC049220]|uniref:hypothetical protein n=1 Tax=Nocardia sp. NPDC049220 TaxID=3155273 RepID=UPI00340EF127